MEIEILYLDGCPNVSATIERVRTTLQEYGLSVPVKEIKVPDNQAAKEYRFIGSPTVRVNGADIEPAARRRTDYGMMCRRYEDGGVPPVALIRDAITGALSRSS